MILLVYQTLFLLQFNIIYSATKLPFSFLYIRILSSQRPLSLRYFANSNVSSNCSLKSSGYKSINASKNAYRILNLFDSNSNFRFSVISPINIKTCHMVCAYFLTIFKYIRCSSIWNKYSNFNLIIPIIFK